MPAQVSHDGKEAGLLCFTYWKGWSFSIQHPLSFVEQVTECLKQTGLHQQNVMNRRAEAQDPAAGTWVRPKACWMFDVLQCSWVSYPIRAFSKVLRRIATLLCQHCESSPGGEKENTFMCWPHPVFPLLSLLLPLPFIFPSVLQIHFFPTFEHHCEPQWGSGEWDQLLELPFLIKWSEGERESSSQLSLCVTVGKAHLTFNAHGTQLRVTWKIKPIKANLKWEYLRKIFPISNVLSSLQGAETRILPAQGGQRRSGAAGTLAAIITATTSFLMQIWTFCICVMM